MDIPVKKISETSVIKSLIGTNRLPLNSRFDANTVISGVSSVGLFSVADGVASGISIVDDAVKISVVSDGGNFRIQDTTICAEMSAISSTENIMFAFDVKWGAGTTNDLYVALESSYPGNTYKISKSTEWASYRFELPRVSGGAYTNRLAFMLLTANTQEIYFRNMRVCLAKTDLGDVERLDGFSYLWKNLSGKNVSIIGDSISTASNNNAVELTVLASDVGKTISGYITQYDVDAGLTIGGRLVTTSDIGTSVSFTPVSGDIGKKIGLPLNYNSITASQTWWGLLCATVGANVLQNVSWSGSSITSHEGSDDAFKTSYAWHDAQIKKCRSRASDGSEIPPDVVIIYRGTNDFSHTPYAKLTLGFSDASTAYPTTDLSGSDYLLRDGIALTVKKLRAAYPFAKIILCTLNVFKRVTYDVYPTRNGVNTLNQYNAAIRECANTLGCGLIEFDKSGITFENIYPTYASDSATIPTHPNVVGHATLAKKAVADLINCF